MIQEKFYATWRQIGAALACKSNMLALEPINEPPATTAQHGALTNEFNNLFVKALAASGGFNSQRVVTLMGPGMDAAKTTQWFVPPKIMTNPWALQYHFYTPCTPALPVAPPSLHPTPPSTSPPGISYTNGITDDFVMSAWQVPPNPGIPG